MILTKILSMIMNKVMTFMNSTKENPADEDYEYDHEHCMNNANSDDLYEQY